MPDVLPATTTEEVSNADVAVGPVVGAPVGALRGAVAPNAMAELYRAALGPVNVAVYLAMFERFDAAGHAGLVWHPAAAFCTLNWLAFRRLWREAFAYAAAMLALVAGVWMLYASQAAPFGVVLGVLGSVLLLGTVLPGLFAHALLHARTRARIVRAAGGAKTLREACTVLEREASSARRLQMFEWSHVLLMLAVVALVAVGWDSRETKAVRAGPAAVGLSSSEVPLVAPAAAPSVQAPPVSEPPTATAIELPPGSVSKTVETTAVDVAQPSTAVTAAMPEATTTAAPTANASASVTATVARSKPTPSLRPAGVRSDAVASQPYAINVGLFSLEANAQAAHARLIEAGLPAYMQEVQRTSGSATRVRVGPFADADRAAAAARRIRELGLDAVVFRQ